MASASVHFNESPIGHCLASVGKGAPNHDGVMVGRTETANSDGRVWGCACACACARVCASVRECARVCASVRECARVCASVRVRTSVHACVRDVFAIYDDNILSRLIMIIIIILYFIQIRHTDDFPSAGIPVSTNNNANACPENEVVPIYLYNHTDGIAIVGGHMYRGCRNPSMMGHFIFGNLLGYVSCA